MVALWRILKYLPIFVVDKAMGYRLKEGEIHCNE